MFYLLQANAIKVRNRWNRNTNAGSLGLWFRCGDFAILSDLALTLKISPQIFFLKKNSGQTCNQWKIYNSRIKKIHINRNVRFDENYSYYDSNFNAFSNFDENESELELNEFWCDDDDNWFDLRSKNHDHSSKRISSAEKASLKKIAQTSSTSESLSSRDTDIVDNANHAENAKSEEKKFIEISKNHDSTFIDELQTSSLSDSSISEISTLSSRISQQNENIVFETREELNENELTDDTFTSSISSTSTRKKRDKTFSSSSSNRDSRLKIDAIARSNYYKTNNLNIKRIKDIKKSKKFVNVVNNVY